MPAANPPRGAGGGRPQTQRPCGLRGGPSLRGAARTSRRRDRDGAPRHRSCWARGPWSLGTGGAGCAHLERAGRRVLHSAWSPAQPAVSPTPQGRWDSSGHRQKKGAGGSGSGAREMSGKRGEGRPERTPGGREGSAAGCCPEPPPPGHPGAAPGPPHGPCPPPQSGAAPSLDSTGLPPRMLWGPAGQGRH